MIWFPQSPEAWSQIDPKYLKKLISRMPKINEAVIWAKRGYYLELFGLVFVCDRRSKIEKLLPD